MLIIMQQFSYSDPKRCKLNLSSLLKVFELSNHKRENQNICNGLFSSNNCDIPLKFQTW